VVVWLVTALAAPFPDLLAPPDAPPAASRPGDAAVVIGIEDYGFLPDVPYARRDAMAVRTLLVHHMGVPAEHVQLLNAANREQLLAAVDQAAAQVGDGGRLVVWFSGHGATSPLDGSMLLVGDDAKPQPDAFATRSVSVAELSAKLPGDALVVLDACAAGQARDGQALLPGTRFALPSWATAEPTLRVWTAAAPTELAEPYPAAEHGLFTALAVGALRGWGDANGDGQVTLDEAQDYVQRGMLSVGGRQRPTVTGPDLPLAPARETGPSFADLPRLTAMAHPTVPKAEPPIEEGPTFVGPFTLAPGGVDTADGRRISTGLLLSEHDSPSVAKLGRQQRTATAVGAGGVAVAGLATVVGGYLAAYHAIYESSGLGTNVSLGTKLAVPAVFVGAGLGAGAGGLVMARSKRRAIVDDINSSYPSRQ